MASIRHSYAFIYVFFAIIFQASSGILAKYAAVSLNDVALIFLVTNAFYLSSLLCLALQAIVWQMALKHYDLSFIYPFISLVNFIILVSSYLLFNESITFANIAGLVIISCGVCLLSREAIKA
jgi:multidrug transporter EmrE-like cation transporter